MEAEKRVVIASSSSSSSSQRNRKKRTISREEKDDREELIYDVVEEILSRLPVKSLIRFKSVSQQWRRTIESCGFTERHLKMAERSYGDNHQVLVVSIEGESLDLSFQTTCLDSANSRLDIGFETTWLDSANSLQVLNHLKFALGKQLAEASNSCDGLVCIHVGRKPFICVVNPVTCWFRQLPLARFQLLMQKARQPIREINPFTRLAFAKAASRDYKLVWLYNSDIYNSDAASPNDGLTKCEVFDFRANAWRYLTFTPSYHIFDDQRPASVNGTVYWLTERHNGETKVIAFHLLTETFQMLPNNPVADSHPDHIDICSLNNRLCMSKRKRKKLIQEIWILQSSSENAWEMIYTIDLSSCCSWPNGIGFSWTRRGVVRPSTPVTVCKNNKILLSHRYSRGLVEYDLQTKSYSSFPQYSYFGRVVSYFQSLISHI